MNDLTFIVDELFLRIVETPLIVLFTVVLVITVLTCIFAGKEISGGSECVGPETDGNGESENG